MARQNKKYQSDSGSVHVISLSAPFAAAAGDEPAGAVSSRIKAKVSKSSREYGLRPRGLRLNRTVGTAPNTFKRYAFLPILTQADWADFSENATVTIGSVTWTIGSKAPEDY